ncbi:MAG: hypothetical protein LLG45_04670, partial [Actinomycetia bacterium]|nr:hypothetical protein [Actinomycetes bacterium]
LALLRTLGVHTVSMSPAGELRAAHDEKMGAAVLTVVANAGDTTHDEVLAGVARAGAALARTVETLFAAWATSSGREAASDAADSPGRAQELDSK